jgi:L-seryl-tRNA(Ser) seleniumtransferase
VELPSAGLALPAAAAAALRAGADPVVARVEHGRCVVDLRSVDPADDARLAAAIRAVGA